MWLWFQQHKTSRHLHAILIFDGHFIFLKALFSSRELKGIEK